VLARNAERKAVRRPKSEHEKVPQKGKRIGMLVASFRNARAVEKVVLRQEPRAARAANKTGEQETIPDWSGMIKRHDGIKAYIDGDAKANPLPRKDDLRKFGAELFGALFPRSVRNLYDVARTEVKLKGVRLAIVFTSMVNWVADKPWEFAYDPYSQAFLASEDTNFTRNVVTGVPSDAPLRHERVMRILVVVAQPIGMGVLSTEEERAVIERGFRMLIDAGLAEIEILLHATADLLHKHLELRPYDVLHFIGHGEYDSVTEEGCLLFEDLKGGAQRVTAENLREILCHRGIRLVFLNACETGVVGLSQNPLDFNKGIAPRLIAGGIPAVVANQYKVLDVSATDFARRFYWSLAHGSSVGDAAREARVAVSYLIAGECIDWAVPVLYARNPMHPLFERRGIRVKEKAPEEPPCRPRRRPASASAYGM
jgi:hypothetical protein